jgi:hypothetical protein
MGTADDLTAACPGGAPWMMFWPVSRANTYILTLMTAEKIADGIVEVGEEGHRCHSPAFCRVTLSDH